VIFQTVSEGLFSEDEMRRPTLETQYLMVCKRYTGS
jgi:hypothetical protein